MYTFMDWEDTGQLPEQVGSALDLFEMRELIGHEMSILLVDRAFTVLERRRRRKDEEENCTGNMEVFMRELTNYEKKSSGNDLYKNSTDRPLRVVGEGRVKCMVNVIAKKFGNKDKGGPGALPDIRGWLTNPQVSKPLTNNVLKPSEMCQAGKLKEVQADGVKPENKMWTNADFGAGKLVVMGEGGSGRKIVKAKRVRLESEGGTSLVQKRLDDFVKMFPGQENVSKCKKNEEQQQQGVKRGRGFTTMPISSIEKKRRLCKTKPAEIELGLNSATIDFSAARCHGTKKTK